MRTFPGVKLSAFQDQEEREQIKIISDMLRQVSGGLSASIEVGQSPSAVINPDSPSMMDFVYRPGRPLGGNDFSFGTTDGGVGAAYDNVASASGGVSTGRIELVAGTVRVRHGNSSNTGNVFEVTASSGSNEHFFITSAGRSQFGSADTSARVGIPWQNGAASSLSIGTPSNSHILAMWPTSTEFGIRVSGGSGGTVWSGSSGSSGTLFRVVGQTTFNNASGQTTQVPLTIRGASSQSGNLQEWQNSASTVLSYIAADGTFNGPIVATSMSVDAGIFYSTAGNPALRLRDQTGASTNLLECQSADGTTNYFTIDENAEVFTWRAGGTVHAIMRVNAADNFEILDGSSRNMLTLDAALANAWEDSSTSAIAYLFDTNPNGHRVILQNVAGPFSRFGILADRMVLDNDASSTPFVPLSMFDIKNTQTASDTLTRWIPHATQSADIWQLRVADDSDKTSWIDSNHIWNYRNYIYSNEVSPNARYIVDGGTFSSAAAFDIFDEATGESLNVVVSGPIVSTNNLAFPAGGGQVATTNNTMTFSNKTLGVTGNTLRAISASSGVAWVDNTTTSKALRMVLSGATGNNSFVIVSTSARAYTFPDATITVAGSATALTSGRVPFATTGGILTDDADFTFATDTLTITKIAATTFVGAVAHDAQNITTDTTTGTKIGTATTQKFGFWNAAPVVQPATTGTVSGHTGGGGTAVTHSDTFTGNTGSTAYTIGDIVNNLKTAGLLAA